MAANRKKLRFNKGVLESAGLGEVSFFLQKAKRQMDYAVLEMRNADLTESLETLAGVSDKFDLLIAGIEDLQSTIEESEMQAMQEALKREDKESEE